MYQLVDSCEEHLDLVGSVIFIYDEDGKIYIGAKNQEYSILRFFQCSDLRYSFVANYSEMDTSLFVEINLSSLEIQEYMKYFANIKTTCIDVLRNHVDSFQKVKAFI